MASNAVRVLVDRLGQPRDFTYGWPPGLGAPHLGDEVVVDLRGHRVVGWVVGLEDDFAGSIKPVLRRRRHAAPPAVVATALAAARWYHSSPVVFLRRTRSPRVGESFAVDDDQAAALPDGPVEPALAWQAFGESAIDAAVSLVEARSWHRVIVACPSERQADRLRRALGARGHRTGTGVEDWRRLATGAPAVVVGTRSAPFAPVRRPDAVLVVDAVDPLHREEAWPHGDTALLAGLRAAADGVPLVFVGAVPPLGAVRPDTRPSAGRWPRIELVDAGARTPGTAVLESVLRGVPGDGSVALVLARSRASEGVRCRDCRSRPACPLCGRPLTIARWSGPRPSSFLARLRAGMVTLAMACTSCDEEFPMRCERCGSSRLAPIGVSVARAAALTEGILRRPVAIVEERGPVPSAPIVVGGVALIDRLEHVDVLVLVGLDDLFGVRDLVGAPRMLYYLHRAGLVANRVVGVIGGDEPALRTAVDARDVSRFYEAELDERRALGLPPSVAMALVEGSLPPEARQALETRCELAALGPARWLLVGATEQVVQRALDEARLGPGLRVVRAPVSLGGI